MTEALFFNLMMYLCLAGVVGWVVTYKPTKGADICSFDIITMMVLKNRKSRRDNNVERN